jgi:hypothetical protein
MGGSNNDAQKEASQQEAARQAAIKQSTSQIDAIFSSPERQAQYAQFLEAARKLYGDELMKQQKENSRSLKFALARSGQTGGSTAVDQGTKLGEAFQKGTIEAERLAQGNTADLKQADERSRLNLIGLAQGGLDATTGIANAQTNLLSNLQAGNATRNVKSVGDVFSGFADMYEQSRKAAGERRANRDYGLNYKPLYGQAYTGGYGGN